MSKKADRQNSIALLKKHRIDYTVRNGGLHLVVRGNGLVIDFWPTTEKFVIRGDDHHYRGVASLLKFVRKH